MKPSFLNFKKALICIVILSAISCSKEDITPRDNLELRDEITDAEIIEAATLEMENAPDENDIRLKQPNINLLSKAQSRIINTNIRRYYHPSRTVHTYYSPEAKRGHISGNYEGIAFRTKAAIGSVSNIGSEFRLGIFFLHPNGIDHVISTSFDEDKALRGRGWRTRGVVTNKVLIYRNGGNGRKRLYRFYKASISDHLFTKNYSEGINNGYVLEGVVGWVY